MKRILTFVALIFAGFGSTGCIAMMGDSYTGYTGYTTGAGRCVHTIQTEQQEDGSSRTVRETVCKAEGR